MDARLATLFDLSGRTALVTGGSSGIGRAIAGALAGAGAHVVLAARGRDALDETAGAFTERGWAASAECVDVADRASLVSLLARLREASRHVDVLVNAAGINLRMPFEEIGDDDWDATIAANLAGPFLLTRALAPAMAARGWGRIVNIASQQAVRAFGNSGAYGASKGGLVSLTYALARHYGPHGIRANTIAPGFIDTPMQRAGFSPAAQAFIDGTPLARQADPSEVATVAVFLASAHASFMTGAIVNVSGGAWMG